MHAILLYVLAADTESLAADRLRRVVEPERFPFDRVPRPLTPTNAGRIGELAPRRARGR